MIQNLVAGYGDDFLPGFLKNLDGFRAAVPFILTLIILVLVGRDRGRAGGSVADEKPPPDHRDGLSAWRRRLPWAIATLALVAFTMQWIDVPALQADTYEQGIIAKGMVFAVIFLSFVVVTGIGGMVSLSQATFVIAGGFMAGWAVNFDWGMDIPLVATHGQLNWLWAVVLAGLVGAAAGAVVALPVRRLGAVALALGTFALAFTADLVIFTQESISNGSNGWFVRWPTLDLPLLPRYDFAFSEQRFVLFLVIFGLGTLMIHALIRSSTGREMLAVRSSEVAARASGIRPARPQILVFALSAGIAGLGGALLAMNDGTISNLSAPPVIGLVWIAVAVTFGIRRPGGALLAGLAFGGGSQLVFNWIGNDFLTGGLHDLITSPYFVTMLFGLGAINLAQNPDGLLAIIGTKKAEKRREKERRAHLVAAEAELHGDEQAESDALAGSGGGGRTRGAPRRGGGNPGPSARHRSRRRRGHDHRIGARGPLARRRRRRVRGRRGAARRVDHHPTGRGGRPPGCQRRGQVDALLGGGGSGRTDVRPRGARRHQRRRGVGRAPGPGRDAADPRSPRHLPRTDGRGEPEGAAA